MAAPGRTGRLDLLAVGRNKYCYRRLAEASIILVRRWTPMELPGSAYLFNLSIVAMTFAAVSALVMLIRQTMGGKLTDFDVYLMVAFVSMGCVLSVDAMLPPLISIFEPRPGLLWGTASGLAAVSLASEVAIVYRM